MIQKRLSKNPKQKRRPGVWHGSMKQIQLLLCRTTSLQGNDATIKSSENKKALQTFVYKASEYPGPESNRHIREDIGV